jgi:ClpP class serine protease
MRDVRIMHDLFIEEVATHRKLSTEEVTTLADGSTMLGDMALEKWLIDAIGDRYTILADISELLWSDAVVCE